MEELIPIVAIVAVFSVPVIAILVNHQRKMAELIHRNHYQSVQPNVEAENLRREIAELRGLIHQQTIAIDDLRNRIAPPKSESNLSERISA